MKELDEILKDSTACVAEEYFLLPASGHDSIYRERVYCYELYHQMRSRWPACPIFKLNGEIDKAGLSFDPTCAKPDFVVHQPGTMDNNYAAIEVKTWHVRGRQIRKDLNVLARMRTNARYERAIYLIYGPLDAGDALKKVGNVAKSYPVATTVEIWLHSQIGVAASRIAYLLGEMIDPVFLC